MNFKNLLIQYNIELFVRGFHKCITISKVMRIFFGFSASNFVFLYIFLQDGIKIIVHKIIFFILSKLSKPSLKKYVSFSGMGILSFLLIFDFSLFSVLVVNCNFSLFGCLRFWSEPIGGEMIKFCRENVNLRFSWSIFDLLDFTLSFLTI